MRAALDLAHRRLVAQALAGAPLAGAEEAVGWLLAVQSQDHGPAKWSLAQRAPGITEAEIDRPFDAGRILRTHVLRPTWHFVAPDDLRALLTATAPRVQRVDGSRYRQLGLDAARLARSADVVAAALEEEAARHGTFLELAAEVRVVGPRGAAVAQPPSRSPPSGP